MRSRDRVVLCTVSEGRLVDDVGVIVAVRLVVVGREAREFAMMTCVDESGGDGGGKG